MADLLRGPYRPPQYERVMLPLTVLRRFDCVLQPSKARVLSEFERLSAKHVGPEFEALIETRLNTITGHEFHRTALSVPHGAKPAWQWRGHDLRPVAEGFVLGRVHASYLHTHPTSAPQAVTRFVRACASESVRFEATR